MVESTGKDKNIEKPRLNREWHELAPYEITGNSVAMRKSEVDKMHSRYFRITHKIFKIVRVSVHCNVEKPAAVQCVCVCVVVAITLSDNCIVFDIR